MGAATKELLERRGDRVIGVDRHDADVVADLGTRAGRQALVDGVAARTEVVDGVIAVAGISGGGGHDTGDIVRVNYFGARATLEGLLPLLTRSAAPRAVSVASLSAVLGHLDTSWDERVVAACLGGDEESAVAAAGESGPATYAAAKRALILWTRHAAPAAEWAGAGILLNVIAPGLVLTPMNRYLFATPERAAKTAEQRPQPLGWGRPEQIAPLLAFLAGAENQFVTGQLVCADGGYEALVRPDTI
jgi:NAD(P)-dependent dehydrogenase (short-subunit alcohol dehydrogenase family)